MKKILFLTILFLSSLNAISAAISVSPGQLSSAITDEIRQATELTVTGTIDARDFFTLSEELPNLTSLNIEAVSVNDYVSRTPLLGGKSSFSSDEIPANAFFGMNLTSVVLPKTITSIGDGAFAGTKISSISIPSSVKNIGSYSFYDCDNLTSLTMPAGVETIGDYAMGGCDNLASVDLSATSLTTLKASSFMNCHSLSKVELPASLVSIGESAFAGTSSLTSISLPGGLRAIGSKAFQQSGLIEVIVPEHVSAINEYAFANCENLTAAIINSENITLGEGLFFYCKKLFSVSMPIQTIIPDYAYSGTESLQLNGMDLSSTETIGKYAFVDNPSKQITYGSNLTFIDDRAMEGMTSLIEVIVKSLGSNVPELGDDVFAGIDQPNVQLTVASDTQETWEAAAQWTEFKISDTSDLVGIEDHSNSIKAWFENTILRIESSNNISGVQIYTTDGKLMISETPDTTSVNCDTSSMPDNIYVVMVHVGNRLHSFKLMR